MCTYTKRDNIIIKNNKVRSYQQLKDKDRKETKKIYTNNYFSKLYNLTANKKTQIPK